MEWNTGQRLVSSVERLAKLTEYRVLSDAYRHSYTSAWLASDNKSRRDRLSVLYKELWPDE